jgi:hypothetical protein
MLKKILAGIESGCSSPRELAEFAGVDENALPGHIQTLVEQGYLAPAGCMGSCASCGGCPSAEQSEAPGILYMTEKGKRLLSDSKEETEEEKEKE